MNRGNNDLKQEIIELTLLLLKLEHQAIKKKIIINQNDSNHVKL